MGLVKGERSEVREQWLLKEPPLSTGLYIAGRDRAFTISNHIALSCHVVNSGHVNHIKIEEWKWNNDDGNEIQHIHSVDTQYLRYFTSVTSYIMYIFFLKPSQAKVHLRIYLF